ncbi:MAG: hypothetical protein JXQ73_12460 [Phycisphaerae bacterium]|nr:hypothetical protein [Phycisphaerae bacterium]
MNLNAPMPQRMELVSQLNELEPALGAILFLAGLVYILMGFRVFKVLVVINCALVGAAVGSAVGLAAGGESVILQVAGALAGAAILGALAVPLLKAGVVLCSGLIGGAMGIALTSLFSESADVQFAGGGVALLVAVSLVFIVFDHLMITVISFQGAVMTLAGFVVALGEQGSFLGQLRSMVLGSGAFMAFCIVALTIIGICVQLAGLRHGASSARPG